MKTLVTAAALGMLAVPAMAFEGPVWAPGVTTGPGGYSVTLVADVTTIVNAPLPTIVETVPVTFNLTDVIGLDLNLNFASGCEFDIGCVISAPLDLTVDGMAGDVFAFGFGLTLNGAPLDFDGGAFTPNGFASGHLAFASDRGFTDSPESIRIDAVPEPPSWSMLGFALLGLAIRPRR